VKREPVFCIEIKAWLVNLTKKKKRKQYSKNIKGHKNMPSGKEGRPVVGKET